MSETKKCPYCGEEILAVARKCKHCGEWLDRKEQIPCPVCGEQIDADAAVCPHCKEPVSEDTQVEASEPQVAEQPAQSSSFYYCKNCKARLSINTEVCPQCGDKDPFYFKFIKNSNILATGLTIFPIALIIAYPMWTSIFSETLTNVSFGIGAVVWLIFLFGMRSASREIASQYFSTMHKIFKESGDPEGVYRWKKDADGRRGFFSNLIGYCKFENK